MVDFVFRMSGYCIEKKKKEGNESLSLIGFGRNVVSPVFVKYSKEDRLSASQVEIEISH